MDAGQGLYIPAPSVNPNCRGGKQQDGGCGVKYYASELLRIARREIGYHEKQTNSGLDNKQENSGDGNWTKYARDLAKAGYYNGDKNGYQWCDVFVDWCFWILSGKSSEAAQNIQCQSGPYGAGCWWSAKYYREAGRFDRTPQVGDQIFFGPEGDDHTGLVEWVSDKKIGTIEGNKYNQVTVCSYSLDDPSIAGYGHPRYAPEPMCNPERFSDIDQIPNYGKKTIAKLLQKGYLAGTASGLDISEDMLRILVLNDRAGLYDRTES